MRLSSQFPPLAVTRWATASTRPGRSRPIRVSTRSAIGSSGRRPIVPQIAAGPAHGADWPAVLMFTDDVLDGSRSRRFHGPNEIERRPKRQPERWTLVRPEGRAEGGEGHARDEARPAPLRPVG